MGAGYLYQLLMAARGEHPPFAQYGGEARAVSGVEGKICGEAGDLSVRAQSPIR